MQAPGTALSSFGTCTRGRRRLCAARPVGSVRSIAVDEDILVRCLQGSRRLCGST